MSDRMFEFRLMHGALSKTKLINTWYSQDSYLIWIDIPFVLRFKHIGVLTAALIVKNMVCENDGESSANTTHSERSLMNTQALKEAENLLCLVMSSTAHSPSAAALFMDELASISLRENMNNKLEVNYYIYYSIDCQ